MKNVLTAYYERNGYKIDHIADDEREVIRDLPTGLQACFPFPGAKAASRINDLAAFCHAQSYAAGWYHDPKTGEPIERNRGEMMMLIVSEISEAMEADRKALMDDKLPDRIGVEVEMADALIRILDYAGAHGLDLGGAMVAKLAYNRERADHKLENRANGGKSY